jgi:hypothetical protein
VDPVGHSEVREGIQRVRGHADAVGQSPNQGEFNDYVGIRWHRDIQAYIMGLRRIQGIRKYIQGSRGMFRVLKGKGLNEFYKSK